MELKFVALEMVGSEAEWLKNSLANIPLGMKPAHQYLCIVIPSQR